VEEKLFSGCEDKIASTVHTLQNLIQKFHPYPWPLPGFKMPPRAIDRTVLTPASSRQIPKSLRPCERGNVGFSLLRVNPEFVTHARHSVAGRACCLDVKRARAVYATTSEERLKYGLLPLFPPWKRNTDRGDPLKEHVVRTALPPGWDAAIAASPAVSPECLFGGTDITGYRLLPDPESAGLPTSE
jgi:hypothetical protein